jgi:hypothetical protein
MEGRENGYTVGEIEEEGRKGREGGTKRQPCLGKWKEGRDELMGGMERKEGIEYEDWGGLWGNCFKDLHIFVCFGQNENWNGWDSWINWLKYLHSSLLEYNWINLIGKNVCQNKRANNLTEENVAIEMGMD